MTPKEKAQELVEKYMPYMYCFMGSGMLSNDYDEKVAKNNAKRCALIAVDEIFKDYSSYRIKQWMSIDQSAQVFWYSVKSEIEKL